MFPNLRAELARKGWRYGELAKLLNMGPSTLSDKLNGKRAFTLEEASEIKKLLDVDVSIDELFKRADA